MSRHRWKTDDTHYDDTSTHVSILRIEVSHTPQPSQVEEKLGTLSEGLLFASTVPVTPVSILLHPRPRGTRKGDQDLRRETPVDFLLGTFPSLTGDTGQPSGTVAVVRGPGIPGRKGISPSSSGKVVLSPPRPEVRVKVHRCRGECLPFGFGTRMTSDRAGTVGETPRVGEVVQLVSVDGSLNPLSTKESGPVKSTLTYV